MSAILDADNLRECLDGCEGGQKQLAYSLIDELSFVQGQLEALKKLPFIIVNRKNPQIQRQTEAGKMYKALVEKYTNLVKALATIYARNGGNEENPFITWLKEQRGEQA